MKSEALVLLIGSLLLTTLLAARARSIPRLPSFILSFFLGLLAAQLALDTALTYFNLDRRSQFLKVLNQATQDSQTSRPNDLTVLLVGSSRTARNVDGKLLQESLRELGLSANVIQLSSPGSFAFEQDYYLEQFLKKSKPREPYIFIELGSDFRGAIDSINRFKNDPVAFHDYLRSFDILKIQLARRHFEEAIVTFGHSAAHLLNIGILRNLTPAGLERRAGFLPEDLPFNAPHTKLVSESINTETNKISTPSELKTYRKQQRERLKEMGFSRVTFVSYPIADPSARSRIEALCAALEPCLSFNDKRTLALLNGPLWTDLHHLSGQGASLLTKEIVPSFIAQITRNGTQ